MKQTVINLENTLSLLFEAIDKSSEISDDEKKDYKSDLQSLASQIGKKNPNYNIIKAAWASLQGLATIEGCAQLIDRLAPMIQRLIA